MGRDTPIVETSGMAYTEPSFAELQRRISAIPSGPSGILDTPAPYRILNILGGIGALIALLPIVLVRLIAPDWWMVTVCQIGIAIMVVMWLPIFVRSIAVLGWTLVRWKTDLVTQLDHDHPHYQSILRWLANFPAHALAERLRTVQLAERQLVAKLGLLAGGVDRLGILPVLVSVYLFIRNWDQLLTMPGWQVILSIFLILLYMISATGSLMRIRLRLFESMLMDSMKLQQDAEHPDA